MRWVKPRSTISRLPLLLKKFEGIVIGIELKNIICVSIIWSLMILSPCVASQIENKLRTFDGSWWLSISGNEKNGFLEGYFDCYRNEYKGSDHYTNSIDQYDTLITNRYRTNNPSDNKQSIMFEIHRIRDRPGESIFDPNGEEITRLAGLQWMQMDAIAGPDMEQRGFVEGYLACHAGLNHSKGGNFSNSADTYVRHITAWYGFIKSTGDLNPSRDKMRIADVLLMFADKSGGPNALADRNGK